MNNSSRYSETELKWFGLLFAILNMVIAFVIVLRYGVSQNVYLAWGMIVAALVGCYYVFPAVQPIIYRCWIGLTYPIGWLISNLLLTMVFCCLFLPIGAVMKLVRYDPLERGREKKSPSTYWVCRDGDVESKRYFKQY